MLHQLVKVSLKLKEKHRCAIDVRYKSCTCARTRDVNRIQTRRDDIQYSSESLERGLGTCDRYLRSR